MFNDESEPDVSCNDLVMEFAPEHPARLYLEAFYSTRIAVCGNELNWGGQSGSDQKWFSVLLNRQFSFSSFTYAFLSYTLVLGEWFDDKYKSLTSPDEILFISMYSLKISLIDECIEASEKSANHRVIANARRVASTLEIGLNAIGHRVHMSTSELLSRWGKPAKTAATQWLDNR